MNSKTYGSEVLDVIFGFGWPSNESTRGWYEKRDTGLWVAEHDGHMDGLLFDEELRLRFAHPTGRWVSEPALPIPFTEAQFKSFLDANALVTEAELREWFSDDDGHLDQSEISRIRDFCPDAAELLELLLGHSSAACSEKAPQYPRPKTDKGSDTTLVDSATKAAPRKRRDLLSPAIEAAQKESKNQFDANAIWLLLVQAAETRQTPFLGVSEDGIKWRDGNDETQFFKLDNLRDRLRRLRTCGGKTR